MNKAVISTYDIKYEKQAEFQALIKKFLRFKKANPKAFEGVKSFELFQQEFGGLVGSYHEMWEFKSKEAMDKIVAGLMKNKEWMKIDAEFLKLVDHTTLTQSIWNNVA